MELHILVNCHDVVIYVLYSFDRCLQTDSWRIVSAGDDKTLKVKL